MTFEETLKNYFENIVKTDEAISAVYDKKKINTCASYVISQAKKQATGKCAVISDEVVYKWARDFYLGDIEKDFNPETAAKAQVVSGADDDETEEEPKPNKEQKKTKVSKPNFEKDQLNLFEF